jgi:transposase
MKSTSTRGKKSTPHRDPLDPPRRRANKQPGHGTLANDRPPIIHIISRDTGEERCWVVSNATGDTCKGIIAEAVPVEGTIVYSDEYRAYHGIEPQHATVNHGQHEWARDDDGDGVREVHCNTCEGAGAALRTFLRPFRGVHKRYLAYYVSTYEALVNAKRVTPALICRMCWPPPPPHAYWT